MENGKVAVALGSLGGAAPLVLMLFLKLTTMWVESPTVWFGQYGGLLLLLPPLVVAAASVLLLAGIIAVKRALRGSDSAKSDRFQGVKRGAMVIVPFLLAGGMLAVSLPAVPGDVVGPQPLCAQSGGE